VQQPGRELFDDEHWAAQGRVVGQAQGRGSALFIDTGFGPAVLRQYLRGGWPARFSRDRYLFTGYRRSRPLREFRILERLLSAGLPVPAPLAAMCWRRGLFYRGWILTRRIADARALADILPGHAGDPPLWRAVGSCVRRFHDHGLVHPDLNARNILVDAGRQVHLLDFDRARISEGNRRAFTANNDRLLRSLEKLWPDSASASLAGCWAEFEAGYAGA
jgi:3-deoxy-D-manno-octulosonic acid kinase